MIKQVMSYYQPDALSKNIRHDHEKGSEKDRNRTNKKKIKIKLLKFKLPWKDSAQPEKFSSDMTSFLEVIYDTYWNYRDI